jgi:hypothetical protein
VFAERLYYVLKVKSVKGEMSMAAPDTSQSLLQYLLKTGPIPLSYLVTRVAVAGLAALLAELRSRGALQFEGTGEAISSVDRALAEAKQLPENAALSLLQETLTQTPEGNQLQVRLSESGFKMATR